MALLLSEIESLKIDDFKDAKTDEDFIKSAMKLCQPLTLKDPKLFVNHDSKNDELAKESLNLGKTLVSQNEPLKNVIQVYNKSMAQATLGSELLAHAFANRSIVLTKAARYEESLKDIQHALESNYPDHLKASLYARKARNLLALNINDNVDETLAEAKKWALKIDEKKRDVFLNDLDKLKNKKFKKPVTHCDGRAFLPTAPDDNPQLLKTSGAIAINNSDKFGRHLVASRNIEAGEPLMVQKSYSMILVSEYRFKCCWNCSKICWSGVPCDICSNIIYCSKKCRDIAFKEHHDFECSVITSLLNNKIYEDSMIMSLRLFTKAFKEFGTLEKLYRKVQEIDLINEFTSHGSDIVTARLLVMINDDLSTDPIIKLFNGDVYDDTKYASVYSLYRKPTGHDFKTSSAIKTAWIIHCLNATTEIFGKNLTELVEDNWALFVGKLLLRHYEINVSNMIAIELSQKKSDDKIRMCGAVINPLIDLCSHSCDRNAYAITSGDIFSLICIHPIKKGEQICISYGPDYREQDTVDRRAVLKTNHGFWCECFPCVNNWSPNENLPTCVDYLSSKTRVELLTVMGNFSDYFSFKTLESLTTDDILKLLSKFFELINLVGKDVSFLSQEVDDLKVLMLYVLKWINSRQTIF